MDSYLLLKALHIIAVVCWFAGLFYLPRLYVYHVEGAKNSHSNTMLKTMERKLYNYIMIPSMLVSWGVGLWLLWKNLYLLQQPWMWIKLVCVVILTAYHFSLGYFRKKFAVDANPMPEKFYRFWNEVPSIILIVVVILAVLKRI